MEKVESVGELAAKVAADPELAEQIKREPAAAIAGVAAPLQSDRWIYRIVVTALGLVAVIAVLGLIIVALEEVAIPDAVLALGSAAVGALAGLLAPSPTPTKSAP